MGHYDNGSSGYTRTKREMSRACDLIDSGMLAEADAVLKESGACRNDLDLHVSAARIKKMRKWAVAGGRKTSEVG